MTVSFWGVQIAMVARALSHAGKSLACDSHICGYLTSLRLPCTAKPLHSDGFSRLQFRAGFNCKRMGVSGLLAPHRSQCHLARVVGRANADLQERGGS